MHSSNDPLPLLKDVPAKAGHRVVRVLAFRVHGALKRLNIARAFEELFLSKVEQDVDAAGRKLDTIDREARWVWQHMNALEGNGNSISQDGRESSVKIAHWITGQFAAELALGKDGMVA